MRSLLRVLLASALLIGLSACSFAGQVHFGDVILSAGAFGDGFVSSFGHHVGIVLD